MMVKFIEVTTTNKDVAVINIDRISHVRYNMSLRSTEITFDDSVVRTEESVSDFIRRTTRSVIKL